MNMGNENRTAVLSIGLFCIADHGDERLDGNGLLVCQHVPRKLVSTGLKGSSRTGAPLGAQSQVVDKNVRVSRNARNATSNMAGGR